MTSKAEILSQSEVGSKIDLFTAWIDAQMARDGQPGLSVGIVHDQELIWASGFGYANVSREVPATSATSFRIGSITKLFTNTAVLQLRDDGKLRLDDPITKHLPWFAIRNSYPDAPPITIHHLLTHTSGLPREAAFSYWAEDSFPSLEQLKETLPQQEAILPAGSESKYSNLAVSLAGEIVAVVSGEDYADYVQRSILDPLGMNNTCVRTPDPPHPQLATGYGRRMPDNSRVITPLIDCQCITPAGNITSTVEDLARFVMLQFRDGPAGGQQILRGNTLREMQRVHCLDHDSQGGWGLGFRIMQSKGKTYVGHGGELKGFTADLRVCPADKTAVIVLANANDGNSRKYLDKGFQWVIPELLKTAMPEPKVSGPDPAWQQYVGKYRDFWGDWQVLILDGGLVIIQPSLPDPTQAMMKLVPVAEHTFRIESNAGSFKGELVTFEMDDGKVRRVKLSGNYTYPHGDW